MAIKCVTTLWDASIGEDHKSFEPYTHYLCILLLLVQFSKSHLQTSQHTTLPQPDFVSCVCCPVTNDDGASPVVYLSEEKRHVRASFTHLQMHLTVGVHHKPTWYPGNHQTATVELETLDADIISPSSTSQMMTMPSQLSRMHWTLVCTRWSSSVNCCVALVRWSLLPHHPWKLFHEKYHSGNLSKMHWLLITQTWLPYLQCSGSDGIVLC